jgi:leader peptidase (prepilin peptidase)/N-methyltransferase
MSMQIIVPLLTGLLAGWLVNYLADVLPHTRRFSHPTCLHCQAPLSLGKFLSLGACPTCGKNRTVRTWIVQVVAVASSLYLWLYPHEALGYWIGFLILVYFALVFVIDLEHRLIMHPVSIVGAFIGLGVGIYLNGILSTLLGGLGGFGIMLVFYLFGVLFARYRERKMVAAGQEPDDEEALGAGDVILAGVLGLFLGWPLIWFGLLVGILLGGLITVPMLLIMLIARRYKEDALMVFIPYGPFFLISATLIIFYLPKLLSVLVPK